MAQQGNFSMPWDVAKFNLIKQQLSKLVSFKDVSKKIYSKITQASSKLCFRLKLERSHGVMVQFVVMAHVVLFHTLPFKLLVNFTTAVS